MPTRVCTASRAESLRQAIQVQAPTRPCERASWSAHADAAGARAGFHRLAPLPRALASVNALARARAGRTRPHAYARPRHAPSSRALVTRAPILSARARLLGDLVGDAAGCLVEAREAVGLVLLPLLLVEVDGKEHGELAQEDDHEDAAAAWRGAR
eukprot:6194256-Pleurochrysis_carterae.AAC.1